MWENLKFSSCLMQRSVSNWNCIGRLTIKTPITRRKDSITKHGCNNI